MTTLPSSCITPTSDRVSVAPAVTLLEVVPVRNEAARETVDGETLTLHLPLRRRWWDTPPLGWVLRLRREKQFALDPLGREVWALCDGDADVETIIEAFAQRNVLRFHEARACVSVFLQTLCERKLIVLAVPDACRPGSDNPQAGTNPEASR